MKQVSRICLVVFACLFLCDCASLSPKKKMDSWLGHTKAELIRMWGPPQQVTSDGQSGEILIYEIDKTWQREGKTWIDDDGNVRWREPEREGYVATRMFYVNQSGVIYHWRLQGF